MSPITSGKPSHPRRAAILAALGIAALASRPSEAQIVQAIRNLDKADPATVAALPPLLSLTGLYTNIGNKATRAISDTNSIVDFEVNSALWSDGSHKERFISVPAGTKVIPTDTGKYTFPDNTVLIKNFAVDTVHGDSTTRIYVETRFLVYQSTATDKKWTGISYRWRRDQRDAELVSPDNGHDTTILVKLNGVFMGKRWRYPSTSDCSECHQGNESAKRGSLGFITPQLNRMIGATNQLQRLVAKNVLTVNPIAGKANPHRWYGLKETGTDATLEKKVRSYFASNCSHCHGNGGSSMGQAAHDFDYFNAAKPITYPQDSIGGWVGKAAMGDGTYSLIRPGVPDSSYFLHKMLQRFDEPSNYINKDQMPPIATSQVDSGAVKVIRDWICSLKPGTPCTQPMWRSDDVNWDEDPPISIRVSHGILPTKVQARLQAGVLSLPATLASAAVELRDSQGRIVPLRKTGNGQYRLPADMQAGAYLLRAGTHSSLLHYLP